jgi:hypothetical protein
MKIATSIQTSQLNSPHSSRIRIDKLFQVIFVGESDINQIRKVEIFTALVAQFPTWEKNNPQLIVEITIDGIVAIDTADTSREFYEEINILNQFWGKDSSKPSTQTTFRDTLLREIPTLSQKNIDNQIITIDKKQEDKSLCQLIIKEPDKGINPFILVPQELSKNNQNHPRLIPLDIEISELKDLCMHVSPAIWIHSTFNTQNNSKKSINGIVIPIEYTMRFSDPLECDDFKIYYVFPSQFQVLNSPASSNEIKLFPPSGQVSSSENLKAEINEVFSQPNTKYFKLWESLGIQDSTLLRFYNSTSVDRVFKEGKVNNIRLQFRVTDIALGEKRENKKLIISIWLSTIIALGIDSTRLAENSKYFPPSTYVGTPFWWALLCISLFPRFIPPIKSSSPKTSRFLGDLVLAGYLVWTSVAFFMGQKLQEILVASKWLPSLMVLTIICGFLTFISQKRKITIKCINR